MAKKLNFSLILILLLALFLRLPWILKDLFIFVFDMGRDMLWVRDIVILKKPYLIGPWGSLEGVFFGPLWYYLLSIPFKITGGDPKGSVLLTLFFNLLTIFLSFVFGKKIKSERFGFLIAFLLAISPLMMNISTFAFIANLLPLTTLIFIYSLYMCLRVNKNRMKNRQSKRKFLMLAVLTASFNFHFEPPMAVFTTLTLFFFAILKSKKLKLGFKDLILAVVFFSLPFVPQMIFELRHNFLQTKSLIKYFKGENESLGGKLAFLPRVINRLEKFIEIFGRSVFSANRFLVIICFFLTGLFVWKIYKKSNLNIKNLIFVLSFSLLIPFLGFIFLFPPELKGWYLYGIAVIYGWFVALVFDFLLEKGKIFSRIIYMVFFMMFTTNIFAFLKTKNIFSSSQQENAGLLRNQKRAIDWTYQDAEEKPFKVFVYTPPIYDYHYQYMFWWYGQKKYGYLPEEYSYLPGETAYVNFKEHYNNPKFRETDLIYLIIEPENVESRLQGWLGHFSDTDLEKRIKLNSGIVIEKRH